MEKKFAIKGSNTLFKVWGIIIFVLTGINVFLGIISIIGLAVSASFIPDFINRSINLSGVLVGFIIGFVIGLIIYTTIQIIAGLVLVRDYLRSKGLCIALSVYYFLGALWGLLLMIAGIVVGSASDEAIVIVIFIIFGILQIAYSVTSGILLIMKRNRAIPWGKKPNVGPNGGDKPVYHQSYAILEGANGAFKGKRYRLEIGCLCRIGRDSTCDIQINHPQISHEHCTIVLLSNGKLSITDFSKNGTFYADTQLPTGVACDVNPGGWLALGGTDNVISLKVYQ